jgi:hypothetical protein
MLGTHIPFRIFKKRDNGVLYVAIPDLLNYFRQRINDCETKEEEEMWGNEISKFSSMVIERIDE